MNYSGRISVVSVEVSQAVDLLLDMPDKTVQELHCDNDTIWYMGDESVLTAKDAVSLMTIRLLDRLPLYANAEVDQTGECVSVTIITKGP